MTKEIQRAQDLAARRQAFMSEIEAQDAALLELAGQIGISLDDLSIELSDEVMDAFDSALEDTEHTVTATAYASADYAYEGLHI